MKISLFATLALVLVANPVAASAPPFSTEAPIAFMKDLSSGAILYSKDADTRIPPASMAKMMTEHVAFRLIQKGELKLDQKINVRPATWKQWHGPSAGYTMFLSPGQEVSVEHHLHGLVPLSGNAACVGRAEELAGRGQEPK